MNRYVYSLDNPVNRSDPGGHESLGEISLALNNRLNDFVNRLTAMLDVSEQVNC